MQTILGSGGAIGTELARELKAYTNKIRLVSRHPKKVNPEDELFSADLTKADDMMHAVEGSEVVYLTVGLPYNLKIWKEQWPIIIRNIINACIKYNTRLVFFDNIYMYDQHSLNGMNEDTPVDPPSKKGVIRAEIVRMIMNEVASGRLKALIARSADFYGPNIKNTSMLNETVIKNLANGRKANWIGSVKFKHSFTYTPDAARATALLGNTDDAYNQVWHLPTAPDPYTGKEWIELIAKELGTKPRFQAVPKWLMKIIGLFIPIMKEMVEMIYQYEQDYVFDSSKFEKRFGVKATPYNEGISNVIRMDYSA